MKIECPNCEAKLEAEKDLYGEIVKCPNCNEEVAIPFKPASTASTLLAKAKTSSDNRKRIPCPMCSEMILKTAKICQYCKSPLAGNPNINKVHVGKIDPFAHYHTEIQGKKKGPVTIIGILGIILACLIIAVGAPLTMKGDGSEGFFIILFGAFIGIACYLWARREPTRGK